MDSCFDSTASLRYFVKCENIIKQSCCLSVNEVHQIIRIFGLKCQHLSLPVQSPNGTIDLILQNIDLA